MVYNSGLFTRNFQKGIGIDKVKTFKIILAENYMNKIKRSVQNEFEL